MSERRGRRAAADAGRRAEDILARDRRRDEPASWCRRRTSSAICAICRPIAEKAHAAGALLIAVFTEAVSLGLVTPPGEMGADIVVGEGQSIGNALNFGGPYVGLFATRHEISCARCRAGSCGETVDAEGRRGFVLTLSTREQHIRREKATSNICTNSGLCALAFTIHMTLLGEAGLRRLAAHQSRQRGRSSPTRSARCRASSVLNETFFNEFTIRVPRRRRRAWSSALAERRRARRRAGLAARCPDAGAATTSSSSPRPRSTPTTTAPPMSTALQGGAVMHEPAGPPDQAGRGRRPTPDDLHRQPRADASRRR